MSTGLTRLYTIYKHGKVTIENGLSFKDISLPSNYFSENTLENPIVVSLTAVGENIELNVSDISKNSFRINKSETTEVVVNYMVSQDKYK